MSSKKEAWGVEVGAQAIKAIKLSSDRRIIMRIRENNLSVTDPSVKCEVEG